MFYMLPIPLIFPLAVLIPNQSNPPPVNITEHRFSPITVYINSLQFNAEWQQQQTANVLIA